MFQERRVRGGLVFQEGATGGLVFQERRVRGGLVFQEGATGDFFCQADVHLQSMQPHTLPPTLVTVTSCILS